MSTIPEIEHVRHVEERFPADLSRGYPGYQRKALIRSETIRRHREYKRENTIIMTGCDVDSIIRELLERRRFA